MAAVDWAAVGGGRDNPDGMFKAHLEMVSQSDVYVSGPGTGLMYHGFLPDGSVTVYLGNVEDREGERWVQYWEQYIGHSVPWMRSIFYPPRLRAGGIMPEPFSALIDMALELVSGGFPFEPQSRPAGDYGISIEAKVFVKSCDRDRKGCDKVLDAMNLGECVSDGWVEMVVNEIGPWGETPGGGKSSCMPSSFRATVRQEFGAEQRAHHSLAPPCREGQPGCDLLTYKLLD